MLFKNNSNFVVALSILMGFIFWCFEAVIDVLFFGDGDDTILKSIFIPDPHELYMRTTVICLFLFMALIARALLLKQESISQELEKHKNNLQGLVEMRTEQLEKLAYIDDLTQIYNRRKFLELAEYEIRREQRYQRSLSITMIDIDNFKKVNDRHGHQAGDQTLQTISKTISSLIRETDIFGRLGGEEFAILLPETSKQNAKELAERIRLCIEITKIPYIGQITISQGVAQLYPDDTSNSFFSRADIALYAAKENGRNRVVTA